VDSTEGWSLVAPATGAPVVSSNGQSATYAGKSYTLKESYNAQTNYVVGEFYWQVQRDQKTSNRDYASGTNLLSMEQTPQELVWSAGSKLDASLVVKAFGLEGKKDLFQRSDVSPFSAAPSVGIKTIIILVLVLLLLSVLLSRCSSCNPQVENCSSSSGYRSTGGSYGGYSGGGGHK
jgi:hypothetical protein